MKKILYILLLLCISTIGFAQEKPKVEISREKIIIEGKKFYLHYVEKGQTIYSICKAYNISQNELQKHNAVLKDGLKAGQNLTIPVEIVNQDKKVDKPKLEKDTSNFHLIRVRRKHTLYSLSKKYDISIDDIYDANPHLRDKGLRRKDTIRIPKDAEKTSSKIDFDKTELVKDSSEYIYHKIKKGETLYRISVKYNVDVEVIYKANPGLSPDDIEIGQMIKVPEKEVKYVATFPDKSEDVKANLEKDTTPLMDTLPMITFPDSYVDIPDTVTAVGLRGPDTLNIVLILPFNAEESLKHVKKMEKDKRDPRLYSVSKYMIRFYEGLLLGLDHLELQNRKINLDVYDSHANKDSVNKIINSFKKTPDLIIGPVKNENIKICLKYADKHKTRLISFTEPIPELLNYNSLISLQPNFRAKYERLGNYVRKEGNPVLILHDGISKNRMKANRIKHFIEDSPANINAKYPAKAQIWQFDKGISSMNKRLSENDTSIVIPVSSDRIFITSVFNSLFQCNKKGKTLLGDPDWLERDYIETRAYSDLSFSYLSPYHLNFSDSTNMKIVKCFRDKFNDEPDKYAFIGFDIAGELIPRTFTYHNNLDYGLLDSGYINGKIMKFRFTESRTSGALINAHTDIIRLNEDYKFIIEQ